MGSNQATKAKSPDWDLLYNTAASQEGHFTTAQAAAAGYSPQLLAKYLKSRRILRVLRGIYRLVHFPAGEHEDLVVIWLWTQSRGVFSHETALMLHELSDALPARAHVTLPTEWSARRLRVPEGVTLYFSPTPESERTWVGAVPATSVTRTLVDCAKARVAPDLVRDAFEEAASRGLVIRESIRPEVLQYLKQFFSIARSRVVWPSRGAWIGRGRPRMST